MSEDADAKARGTGVDPGARRYGLFDLDQTLVPYDTQLLMCNRVLRTEGWRRLYLLLFVPVAVLGVCKLVSVTTMKRVFLSYWATRPAPNTHFIKYQRILYIFRLYCKMKISHFYKK
jgi:hypothetical protein